jgi:hypothetical protein
MTQPSFVPIAEADQVRPALRLEAPRAWVPDRPAEVRFPARPGGPHLGSPGPDQGFALRLARRFEERIQVHAGESPEDVLVGCALLASRRSSLFGRGPTVHDVDTALTMWGYLDAAPPEGLVEVRRMAFSGVARDYATQRDLVDRVPETAIRMRAGEAAAAIASGEWRQLVGA